MVIKMKNNKLFLKNDKELNKKLNNLIKEKFSIYIQNSYKKTQKTHLFKILRRDIARIKTILLIKKKREVIK